MGCVASIRIARRIVGMMSTDRTGASRSSRLSPAPAKTIGIRWTCRCTPPWSPATEYVVLLTIVVMTSAPYRAAPVLSSSRACRSNHRASRSPIRS